MTVQLYEGCWGVTGGGEKRGPIGRNFRTGAATHHWRCDTNAWTANGAWDASGSLGSPDDIIAVFATEAEADAYLAGETDPVAAEIQRDMLTYSDVREPPAPKPVTWPDGAQRIITERRAEISIIRDAVSISGADGLYGRKALIQLAALLLAAADKVEGRG